MQQRATQRALETGDLADKKILHPKDRIRHVLEGYLPTAVKKTNFLSTLHDDMETSFNNCLIYYCEEPKDTMSRSQFFQKFDFFIKDYKRVKKENFDMEEETHRAEMRRKALLKAGQKNILDQAMNQSPNHAVMDNLLEKLRIGPDPEARRTRKRNLPARRPPTSKLSGEFNDEKSIASISGPLAEIKDVTSLAAPDTDDDLNRQSMSSTNAPDRFSPNVSSSTGNSILAARAQSMLAGLRSGKVVQRASTEITATNGSATSPIRFGLAKAAKAAEDEDEDENAPGRDSPTPSSIQRSGSGPPREQSEIVNMEQTRDSKLVKEIGQPNESTQAEPSYAKDLFP